jgi:hypothetical protein
MLIDPSLGVAPVATACLNLLEQVMLLDWVGPLCLCHTEVARVPRGIPGVYVLQAFVPSAGQYLAFYVGQTSDLARRLGRHLSNISAKQSIRMVRARASTYFSAAPVLEEDLRLRIEAGLIRRLSPICNAQIPSSPPLCPNLPLSFVPFLFDGSDEFSEE